MSQFYAEIQGTRGKVSRQGSKKSGMWAHIRGENIGVLVRCYYDEKLHKDVIYVERTSGSNGRTGSIDIVRLTEGKNV